MPMSNTSTTQTASMGLDRPAPRPHHPLRTLMKTWAPPTPTRIPYLLLVTPNPNSLEKRLPSISLIEATAFKQLIDVGEEVYTINIQLTRDYLDIVALRAVSNQPAPTSALHSEPLP